MLPMSGIIRTVFQTFFVKTFMNKTLHSPCTSWVAFVEPMVLLIQSIHYKCQLCFLVIDSCKTCCLLFIMAHSRRRGCRLKCRSMRLPQYWAFAAYIKVLIGFGIRQQSFTVTLANFQCSNSRTAVSLWSIVFSHLDPVLHLSWFLYVLEIIACVPIMTLMQSLQCTEHSRSLWQSTSKKDFKWNCIILKRSAWDCFIRGSESGVGNEAVFNHESYSWCRIVNQ